MRLNKKVAEKAQLQKIGARAFAADFQKREARDWSNRVLTQLQHINCILERSGMRILRRSFRPLTPWAEYQSFAHLRARFTSRTPSIPLTRCGRCFTTNPVHRVTRPAPASRRELTDVDSTIYALSTAPGRAAIAIIRVSGPACIEVRTMPDLRIANV